MTEGTSTSDSLCLDQSLKLLSFAEIRGRAKLLIQNGEVKVNGEIETRRRREPSEPATGKEHQRAISNESTTFD
jgi:ribosome-associated protein